jgi:hypothetical protein
MSLEFGQKGQKMTMVSFLFQIFRRVVWNRSWRNNESWGYVCFEWFDKDYCFIFGTLIKFIYIATLDCKFSLIVRMCIRWTFGFPRLSMSLPGSKYCSGQWYSSVQYSSGLISLLLTGVFEVASRNKAFRPYGTVDSTYNRREKSGAHKLQRHLFQKSATSAKTEKLGTLFNKCCWDGDRLTFFLHTRCSFDLELGYFFLMICRIWRASNIFPSECQGIRRDW